MKEAMSHGDVTALSIYANQLVEKAGDVLHGVIREVSLVLAGANPEALIEDAMIAHGDLLSDEVLVAICDDCSLSHADFEKKKPKDEEDEDEDDLDEDEDDSEDEDDEDEEVKDEKKLKHADTEGKTVGEVLKTLNSDQKKAVAVLIDAISGEKSADKSDEDEEDDDDMKHNVFENDTTNAALIHDALNDVLRDGPAYGSLRKSYAAHKDDLMHATEYGIDGIETLFPDFKNINGNGAPEFIKRQPDDWVSVVLNGVHHTPYSRIKMMFADITGDDARAKGYAKKGKYKTEEVFGLLKRTVGPTTIYKKQKFDRDDLIDITDFDVLPWVRQEMRMMLDEELARAILVGDGRSSISPDKIKEDCIIPIIKEEGLFRYDVTITPETGESYEHAFIRTAIESQDDYEGSGNTVFFMPQKQVTKLLLIEDGIGHRLYKTLDELATGMSVNRIVKLPGDILPEGTVGLIVDLKDYNVGADKGGSVNMMDDFDINYNQEIMLLETRCSGALTRPFSAIVLKYTA